MDLVFYGFAVLLFAACILMVEGAWLWWSGTHGSAARRINRRLRLMAARGELADRDGYLARRYRLPSPRVELREALRKYASAAADVSDGLIADAGHIAKASGLAVDIDLDRLPLSSAAQRWLEAQSDRVEALRALASGGDDYEVVCTAAPEAAAALGLTVIGTISNGTGTRVRMDGGEIAPGPGGWKHVL